MSPAAGVDLDRLVPRLQAAARLSRPAALRWLRAGASLLADWGGAPAARLLRDRLPSTLRRGRGSRGWSELRARAAAGPGGAVFAHMSEAGRRAGEQDPVKVAGALRLVFGLLREALGESTTAELVAALPEPLAAAVAQAGTSASFPYHLIPQSYARPPAGGGHGEERGGHGHAA